MEFVRLVRFAEFKKKLGASHVLASLIGRAIEDHSSNAVRILYFRIFFVEVNKPFGVSVKRGVIFFSFFFFLSFFFFSSTSQVICGSKKD